MSSGEGSNRVNEGHSVNIVNGVNSSGVAGQARGSAVAGVGVLKWALGLRFSGRVSGIGSGGRGGWMEHGGERGLLVGWQLLDLAGSVSVEIGRETDGAGVREARGPLAGALGGAGGSVQPGGGGRRAREEQRAGAVVCSLPGEGSALRGMLAGRPRAGGLSGDPEGLGEAGWAWLRGLSIDECAVGDYPSLMVPKKMQGLFTECVMIALRRMRVDTEDADAYKLFFLLPRLVLQPVQQGLKKQV
ncbi:hypothetical protein CYMTET_10566 [Cymbomonas tetramitiformis]|uniref:Uncharacterized protein n=1 Tax=Cymbomonas tetramitiformis TaxID=36881 RepID=A0AAE0GNZ0_9CHLO|nr:hypothetical protein CYMTET_10566 [Cymbomonas tetramitiformis]